jgi:hypothetical protein
MKKNLLNHALAVCTLLLGAVQAVSAQTFVNPESICYDSALKTYYVSNVNAGTIVKVNAAGQITGLLKSGLNGPFGLKMHQGVLYFADVVAVKGVDPSTGNIVLNVPVAGITSGQYLNDIEIDSAGFLYVTYTGGNKLFKVNLSAGTYTTFVSSGLSSPNGLLLDAFNNRLLLCSYRSNSPIQAISLADSTVTTVTTTNLSFMDGFVRDKRGDYYINAWTQNAVYRFDSTFSAPPVLVKNGLNGPADMYYNPLNDTLAVPLYQANKITFISLAPVVTGIEAGSEPVTFSLSAYPNPANETMNVEFTLEKAADVVLDIVSVSGRRFSVLNGHRQAGKQNVALSCSTLLPAQGTYILQLIVNGQSFSKTFLYTR